MHPSAHPFASNTPWPHGSLPELPQLPEMGQEFRWGAATAAYQIEGSPRSDGKGESIWDRFVQVPGAIKDGTTGEVACDSYRKSADDVAVLSWLGMKDYRFSISWPRIRPDGGNETNQAGLDYYEKLVDALLEAGIRPVPTLYHWDLPQTLEEEGGWLNPETVERFEDYVRSVAERLGDRVDTWITINEPVMTTLQGYGTGELAPGRQLLMEALPTAHHQLLAHARAARVIKETNPGAKVGISNNHAVIEPASENPEDQAAAQLFDLLYNKLFSEPLLAGRYPDMQALGACLDVPQEELDLIKDSADFYGVNFYNPMKIGAPGPQEQALGMPVRNVDYEDVPKTGFGWPVIPEALTGLLLGLKESYGEKLPPILITENGCSYPDGEGVRKFQDTERIQYLASHLKAVRKAIDAGVGVEGYYVWSLMDNFEWADGYLQRFGLVHVDFETGERTPRLSAFWWKEGMGKQPE